MIVWLDLETTGLNPERCNILEVAAVVTDDALNEVAAYSQIVYSPIAQRVLEQAQAEAIGKKQNMFFMYMMEMPAAAVVEMHTKNGLWKEVRYGTSLRTIDDDFATWLRTYSQHDETVDGKTVKVKSPLAGNTISFDRGFMDRWMPRSHEELHYRNIDVSSLKETVKRFFPETYARRVKTDIKPHRAMADIKESIREYRFYIDAFRAMQYHAEHGKDASIEGCPCCFP